MLSLLLVSNTLVLDVVETGLIITALDTCSLLERFKGVKLVLIIPLP